MPALTHTSVPAWAVGPVPPDVDDSGASYLLLGVGPESIPTLEGWADGLADPAIPVVVHRAEDVAEAGRWLTARVAQAQVGVRLRIAGSVGACLTLRGTALTAGLDDDEVQCLPVAQGAIDVFCAHCRAVTGAVASIGAVVPCTGCARDLVVYHHVSRRTGWFLGYKADAEVDPE